MKRAWIASLALIVAACGGDAYGGPLFENPETPNASPIASVGGTVFDAQTGLAIEGATVTATGLSTASAADGRYELTGITMKVIVLEVSKAGYVSRSLERPVNPGHNPIPLAMQQAPVD